MPTATSKHLGRVRKYLEERERLPSDLREAILPLAAHIKEFIEEQGVIDDPGMITKFGDSLMGMGSASCRIPEFSTNAVIVRRELQPLKRIWKRFGIEIAINQDGDRVRVDFDAT